MADTGTDTAPLASSDATSKIINPKWATITTDTTVSTFTTTTSTEAVSGAEEAAINILATEAARPCSSRDKQPTMPDTEASSSSVNSVAAKVSSTAGTMERKNLDGWKLTRAQKMEQKEKRQEEAFKGSQLSRQTSIEDPWKELGMYDSLTAKDLVEGGTVEQIHELVRKQYKIKALIFHPDKNESETAEVAFTRVKQARDDLLSNVDISSLQHSWHESTGEEEERGEMYPQGISLVRDAVMKAVKSRTFSSKHTSSMPSKIPLRPEERNKSQMTEIVLQDKQIASHQFVAAKGKRRRDEDNEEEGEDAAEAAAAATNTFSRRTGRIRKNWTEVSEPHAEVEGGERSQRCRRKRGY